MRENNEIAREEKLKAPFNITDIQWRVITSGDKNGKIWAIVAPYLDSRAIMERLDDVVGANNWQTHYIETAKGFLCELTIDGVTKSDGADCTDIEPTKGGISDALKRTGVPWGIGRYLYKLPTPMYADISPSGKNSSKAKNGTYFKWNPPKLPSWALPKGTKNTSQSPQDGSQGTKGDNADNEATKKYHSAMEAQIERLGKDEFDAVLYACFDIKDGSVSYKTITDKQKREDVWNALNKTTKESK